MDSDRNERLARMRESAEISGRQGEAWLEKLKPGLKHLPKGSIIAINCATGEYVTGGTYLDASHKFEERFGKVAGWMHEIGGGIFVGGGIV